jgi:hypothetical protein
MMILGGPKKKNEDRRFEQQWGCCPVVGLRYGTRPNRETSNLRWSAENLESANVPRLPRETLLRDAAPD